MFKVGFREMYDRINPRLTSSRPCVISHLTCTGQLIVPTTVSYNCECNEDEPFIAPIYDRDELSKVNG